MEKTNQQDTDLSCIIRHTGDNLFEVVFSDGSVKKVGPSLRGIIRFTFFEDFTTPPLNWKISRGDLFFAYFPKVPQYIREGKIKMNNE